MDPTTPTTEETLWTAKDVARYLKASIRWVYAQAAEGGLPTRRIGNLVRFDPGEIRELGRPGEPARILRLGDAR